jgi:hypothetical protein
MSSDQATGATGAGPAGAGIDVTVTLHLIATGIVKLAETERTGTLPDSLYPGPLQCGLDRLTLLCLVHGVPAPQSVPELLSWCHRPFGDWGVALDDESVGPADTLLDGPMVTRACEEWAVDGSDPEAHVLEQCLLLDVPAATPALRGRV